MYHSRNVRKMSGGKEPPLYVITCYCANIIKQIFNTIQVVQFLPIVIHYVYVLESGSNYFLHLICCSNINCFPVFLCSGKYINPGSLEGEGRGGGGGQIDPLDFLALNFYCPTDCQ